MSTGDFPANPRYKAGYHLEFNDEFEGPDLDPARWLPVYLPHWSSRTQSAPNYVLQNGTLVLQILRDQEPWCPEFDGEIRCSAVQSGLYCGPVGSSEGQLRFRDDLVVRQAQENVRLYTPQFGYFEIRARGVGTAANHSSLYMIGYADAPQRSAEITIFEQLGSERGAYSSVIRYGVHPWADPAIHEESYVERFEIDAACYHIYAVEWTRSHLDFFIDNVRIRRIDQSPQYPMQFMLTLYELPFAGAWTGDYDPADPYPKTFAVDYVRGYRPA